MNVCTHTSIMYALPYQRVRGPVGVGWCACDKTNIVNHTHAHLVGVRRVIMHSASDPIGPAGRSQRSRHEPAWQVWCV